jgi:hypothetical protein
VQEKEAFIKIQQQRLDSLETEIARQQDQLALLQARFENRPQTFKAQIGFMPFSSARLDEGWPLWGGLTLLGIILFRKWSGSRINRFLHLKHQK